MKHHKDNENVDFLVAKIFTNFNCTPTESYHPTDIVVKMVGTATSDQGCSCKKHEVCGSAHEVDSVVIFEKIMLIFSDEEETAIAVNAIANGTVGCHVGFLPHYMTPKVAIYDGAIAQIMKIYDKYSKSTAMCKKFHHNLGLFVVAVISHIN